MVIVDRVLIKQPCFVLSLFGVSPFNREKTPAKCVLLLVFQFLLVSTGIMSLKNFHSVDPDVWLTCITASQGDVKVLIALLQKEKFMELANMLNTFQLRRRRCGQRFEEVDKKFEHYGKTSQLAWAWFGFVSYFCFVIKPILMKKRILPSVGYVPCDIRATLACYLTCYVSHCFGGVYTLSCFMSSDCLFWSLLGYGYLELQYIKYNLLSLNTHQEYNGDDAEIFEQIRSIVEHHAQILTYFQQINHAFSSMLIYQFCATLCTLGMALFCLTADGFPPSFTIMLAYSPYYLLAAQQIFVYCIVGGIISDQSLSVADAAYNSKWWNKHQPNARRALCLIIGRSQREVKITVGGLWELNLNTFCSVVKAAMTMLAFMKNLYGRT